MDAAADGGGREEPAAMLSPSGQQLAEAPATTRYRCVTLRRKQNKYQSQVSIVKSGEKGNLPPHLARLTSLTGGFYADPVQAARASDKILHKLKRRKNNGLLTEEEKAEVDAMSWEQLMSTLSNCKPKTSIYRGVNWHSYNELWEAKITNQGRRVVLGLYQTELEAARVYDSAASHVLGSEARLNLREEPSPPSDELLARLIAAFGPGGKAKQERLPSSIFQGVSTNSDGVWFAQVEVNGRSVQLGEFDSEDAAAQKYDQAMRHLNPDAQLNFPDVEPPPLEARVAAKLRAATTAAAAAATAVVVGSSGAGAEAADPHADVALHRKSQYRGVWWDTRGQRWELRIMVAAGKSRFLGQYEDEEAAARAYDSVLYHLRGAEAKLNFPGEVPAAPAGELAARLNGTYTRPNSQPPQNEQQQEEGQGQGQGEGEGLGEREAPQPSPCSSLPQPTGHVEHARQADEEPHGAPPPGAPHAQGSKRAGDGDSGGEDEDEGEGEGAPGHSAHAGQPAQRGAPKRARTAAPSEAGPDDPAVGGNADVAAPEDAATQQQGARRVGNSRARARAASAGKPGGGAARNAPPRVDKPEISRKARARAGTAAAAAANVPPRRTRGSLALLAQIAEQHQ